jgi:RNA polymerase sigma-70 factor (ECF subfamily)
MHSALPPPDPVQLLAEVGWLRALAARLVGRRELAEDVVQETLLAAIERRREWESERGLRAWLAAVVQNLVRRAYRRERARPGVERAGARGEATESAGDALERVELHRLLVEAVLALEEPYRSAVIWRHLDGLPPEEIAARQGTSVETARQRVSRGLAKRRERLDARFEGGRAAWCAHLASSMHLVHTLPAGASASSAGAITALGGIAVASKAVWIGAAAVVLAALAWMIESTLRPTENEGHGGDRVPVEGIVAGASSDDLGASAGDPIPREVAGERESEQVATVPVLATLSGRVVDREGRGIAGAHVGPEGSAARALGLQVLTTGPGGMFEWKIHPRMTSDGESSGSQVSVLHADFLRGSATIEPGVPCEIPLAAKPRITGRLLAPDGLAALGRAEVRLLVTTTDGRTVETSAVTDSEGRFEARTEEGRLVELEGRVRGFAESRVALDIGLVRDGSQTVDLTLARGITVRGIVLDSTSREPIPGALVYAERHGYDAEAVEPVAEADDRGRFELSGVQIDESRAIEQIPGMRFGILEIDACAKGYAPSPLHRSAVAMREEDIEEVDEIEIALEPVSSAIQGLVLDVDGTTATGGQLLQIIDSMGNLHFASTDGDGRFRVEELPSGSCSVLAAQGRDWRANDRAAAAHAEELVAGRTSEITLVLRYPDASIHGRMLDSTGDPVRSVKLEVESVFSSTGVMLGFEKTTTSTDADGVYRFEKLQGGRCNLRVSGKENAEFAFEPPSYELVLEPGERREGVDFRAWPAIEIAGRVETADGSSAEYDVQLRDPESGARLDRATTGIDGSFSFSGVMPGVYVLLIQKDDREVARLTVGPGSEKDLLLHARE